jgi:hypothetical protein
MYLAQRPAVEALDRSQTDDAREHWQQQFGKRLPFHGRFGLTQWIQSTCTTASSPNILIGLNPYVEARPHADQVMQ